MKQKYYLIIAIIVVLAIIGIIFISSKVKQEGGGYLPREGVGAFTASNDFYLNQGESKSFSLDKYNVNIDYLSSSPQTIKFSVDDETKTITINENEGCITSYKEECTIQNNEKNCELVPEKTTCKIAGICLKDYVVFGVDSEKDDWNTPLLHIFSAVTVSPCMENLINNNYN